ncbi:1-phosphatidylinositol 4,5-bisphosphate phosphodiesterase-like [Centruroides sculpturatus]|uniref:1-phosphatidylinositol 4,5-bisphosphate phosphodiesterase-like n=1 Tax=Centruroides sculpturatus TaxID=218467 RepID=UPI000C6CA6A4|nr:1-phosphatidylinositol 4,5-bisphosphate phosphodiesterase-like [Centruroides sculpturatus]XP_023244011.1 1-phosphatidylinositol 4,5-bisphosphate phosphodiesterase-like [Centruroides sculpturatus]XP_023244018.1 1-phosphatidylinositol 4,5-bisphosphate phosphodiesterase-like [Centruroides sculpturatus]
MTKAFDFNWRVQIPELLLNGCNFDLWEEEKEQLVYEQNAFVRVDEFGFFIYWKSEGKDGQSLELTQVNDIRQGGIPKVKEILIINLLTFIDYFKYSRLNQ